MTVPTITVQVPPEPVQLALFRTAVGGFAAHQHLTIDQVDDVRMAVEEAAVQLLRQVDGQPLTLDMAATEGGLELRVHATTQAAAALIEPDSWSMMILRALTDDLRVEREDDRWVVTMVKNRLPDVRFGEAG